MKNQVKDVYQQAERFAELTKNLIITGNISRAKKCFGIAEKIFATGNNEAKTAIANVYLFSISCFMEMRRYSVQDLFPDLLKNEYSKQIRTSCI